MDIIHELEPEPEFDNVDDGDVDFIWTLSTIEPISIYIQIIRPKISNIHHPRADFSSSR